MATLISAAPRKSRSWRPTSVPTITVEMTVASPPLTACCDVALGRRRVARDHRTSPRRHLYKRRPLEVGTSETFETS